MEVSICPVGADRCVGPNTLLRGTRPRADTQVRPYGEKGRFPQPPKPAAHSEASAPAGSRKLVGIAAKIIPKVPSNFGQSLSHGLRPCQLPLHKGAFGDGGCGLPRRPVGPPRNDNGFLSFRGAERRGNPYFYDGRGFGPPYLGRSLRRPNFVPKFGASVKSSAPTERRDSYRNHPSQRRTAERLRRGHEEQARIAAKAIPKGGPPRDCRGSALSAERVAGQIRFLPDNIRVQHGVQRSEASAKPRPCSRRGCVN